MKCGIIVNRAMIERGPSDPYGRLFSYPNETEDLDYDLGWCGHHRFSESTAFGQDSATEPSAPLAMLAPLLARTRTMKFCTNIMLVPARHPLELAEEINTINEMGNNRFILGAGIGYKPDEFENCGWIISFAEHLLELQDKVATYKAIAAEHARPSTVGLMRDVHVAPTRASIDPDFLPNIIKVWQSYGNIGADADRDPLSSEVMFGGKEVSLEEFAPNRAVVGSPDDCCQELERILDILNPEWFFVTPTGVPDPDRQIGELRLFAREVMPHFRSG